MDEIFNKMGGEEAWLAPYYAGDALTMMDDNPYLAAVFPKEGTNMFVDAMCIPRGARNKEGAEAFINFMLRPEIAAMNSEYIGYSTPHSGAYGLLDAEIRGNPVAYPADEILANTEMFVHLPDDTNRLIDSLWIDIRGGSTSDNRLLFPIILAVIIVLLLVLIIARNKRRKRNQ
jgi:spermidine/putrescine transport system substrate-binding protein